MDAATVSSPFLKYRSCEMRHEVSKAEHNNSSLLFLFNNGSLSKQDWKQIRSLGRSWCACTHVREVSHVYVPKPIENRSFFGCCIRLFYFFICFSELTTAVVIVGPSMMMNSSQKNLISEFCIDKGLHI